MAMRSQTRCPGLVLLLAACASNPGSPPAAAGKPDEARAIDGQSRAGECANVGDVLQRRKCLDTIERERERFRATSP